MATKKKSASPVERYKRYKKTNKEVEATVIQVLTIIDKLPDEVKSQVREELYDFI